ncbi:MAG: hypothetical protein KC620_23780 [Myxococcales bacterium]|nr:hypothetical protein [Myxococcales bacterium]
MSRVDAPLFSHCDALSRALLRRVRSWPPGAARLLGEPIVAAGLRLHCEVAVALVFPDRRARALRRADEAAARLRVLLGLTDEAPALLDAGARA